MLKCKEKYRVERRKMEKQKILLRDFIIINVASGGAILIMLGVILLQRYNIIPSMPCPFHELFHIYCPGCGGTRALFELFQGHILESLYCNPAVFLGLILILYYEIGAIVTIIKNNGKCYYYQKGKLIYGYLIIVTLFTVVRNYLLVGMKIDMLGDFL